MSNNTQPATQTPPTLAQIYEKTYAAELGKLTNDFKARVLAAVGDDTNADRLVREWIGGVTSKAEVEYDILTIKPAEPVKCEPVVKNQTEAAAI